MTDRVNSYHNRRERDLMKPANLLFIMSDEHSRDVLGCSGNGVVKTPHLDRLAVRGTRFSNAYTPSPVCVSARASLATGRHVHEIGAWSSAEPYHGKIPSWGHRLRAEGHQAVSVGKLHFRSRADDNGFAPELLPLHIVGGVGFTLGLLRDKPLPPYDWAAKQLAEQVGAGGTRYTHYDRAICTRACDWLATEGRAADKPWVLFVSFVSPHYPLIAPQPFYDLYDGADIGPPHRHRWQPDHPVLKDIYAFYHYNDYFSEQQVREGRRGYYGLVSFVDDLVGRLLGALEASGLAADTRVLYTSDHGELLGDHGMWTKMLMYEGSAGIPLLMAGPDVPQGAVVETPVSLIDCYQTVRDGAGLAPTEAESALPGRSLFEIAGGTTPDRVVLSEFHDGGTPTGYFMIRLDDWKYVHYAGSRPQLFNLAEDPCEEEDLGQSPAHASVRRDCEARLRHILDPDAVNARAFADQRARIADLGGREAILADHTGQFGFTPLDDIAEELALVGEGSYQA